MPDIQEPKKEVTVSGEEALKVADALTATTMKMLKLLWDEPSGCFHDRKKTGSEPSLHQRTSKDARRTKTTKRNLHSREEGY